MNYDFYSYVVAHFEIFAKWLMYSQPFLYVGVKKLRYNQDISCLTKRGWERPVQSRDVYKVMHNRYVYTYIYANCVCVCVCVCARIIYRRKDVETSKRFSVSRIGLPSGSLAMTVLLRSTPPFLSSVQHIHIHHVYEIYTNNLFHYIMLKIFIFNIDKVKSHNEKLSLFSSIYLILTHKSTISLPYQKNILQKSED